MPPATARQGPSAYVLTVWFLTTRLDPLPGAFLGWAAWVTVAAVGVWAVPRGAWITSRAGQPVSAKPRARAGC